MRRGRGEGRGRRDADNRRTRNSEEGRRRFAVAARFAAHSQSSFSAMKRAMTDIIQ